MSASHNPGGPEYDWGIKVYLILELMHEPCSCFALYILLQPVAFGFAIPNTVSILNAKALCYPNSCFSLVCTFAV